MKDSNAKRHAGKALKMYRDGTVPDGQDEDMVKADMFPEETPGFDSSMQGFGYSKGGLVSYHDGPGLEDDFVHNYAEEFDVEYHGDAKGSPFPRKMSNGGQVNPEFVKALKAKRGY